MADVEYFGVPPTNLRYAENRYRYSATSGQTVFAAIYAVGYVDVYYNGALLDPSTGYTATNGTNIVLTNPAVASSIVVIVSRPQIQVLSDDYIAAMNAAVSTSATNAATATTKAGEASASATAAAASAASSASSAALIVTGGSPFLLNPSEITADVTLPSGFNAASAGPIEIANNVNVTISDNSTWSIV